MTGITTRVRAYCERHGLRCPAKKLIVAEYLQKEANFVDAGTLYLGLRNNLIQISPATVYQSLSWLINAGFVETQLHESKHLYRLLPEEI